MSTLTIKFVNDFSLDFDLENHPIADRWAQKMAKRHAWSLDDAKRFYGFGSQEQEQRLATSRLTECIDIINSYDKIIDRKFTSIDDQDMLNYLHNIFERYHGLLDQQNTVWWNQSPERVKKSLADLNICVHRAESVARENLPRFVCTWFGMPKTDQLEYEEMIKYGRLSYEFGGVYLNYVEIGKTLEDLSIDDDQYISDAAFQPFLRYSADFNVRFYDKMVDVARIYRYFEQHRNFFSQKEIYSWDDYRTKPLRYKVASLRSNLERPTIIERLSKSQQIIDIYLQ